MTDYRARLLTPPREEEERPLYRPVWPSLITETGLSAGIMVGLFVFLGILGVPLPAVLRTPLNIVLVGIPVGLWWLLSVAQEARFPYPRHRLMTVFIVSLLTSQAIAPLLTEQILRVSEWLPLAPALNRIVGYMFTVGLVEVGLCYIVLYTLAWPDHLRSRSDVIAYSVAATLGFTVIPNLNFAITGSPNPFVVGLTVFATISTLLVANLIVAYGLAGVRFDGAGMLSQASALAVASAVIGVAIPVRTGLLNATFSVAGDATPRYLFAIGFALVVAAAGLFIMRFLFDFAERRALERRPTE